MLQRLYIQNYAIIDEVDISFADGHTIITGETGAGKSILLGAMSLILGDRADTKVLYESGKKCIVEGQFNIRAYDLSDFFRQEELDYEDVTIIRREITPSGKSRAFINDTPVNLATLKQLSDQLVDLHSQHETLSLGSGHFQLAALDAMAQHNDLLKKYKQKFKIFKENQKRLESLKAQNQRAAAEQDYLQFQFNELEEAHLKENEQEAIEQELETLENTEEIKRNLLFAANALSNDEAAALNTLREVANNISSVQKYHERLSKLKERLDSALIELEDIAREMEDIEQSVLYDEERVTEIRDRLDILYKLEKKHGVQSEEQLIDLKNKIEGQLQSISTASEDIEHLQKEVEKQKTEVLALAEEISDNRQKQVPELEKAVNNLLKEVGMPNAELKVEVTRLSEEEINNSGADKVQFLFAPNKGSRFTELKKVASGGELSRLMLAIKSLIARSTALPTLIFDEIDTGISGEVALKVGKIMSRLSAAHQVITITHLPQIAGKGNLHYLVYKEDTGGRTKTGLRALKGEERVVEIAKMLSGASPSEAAIENAKELIG